MAPPFTSPGYDCPHSRHGALQEARYKALQLFWSGDFGTARQVVQSIESF